MSFGVLGQHADRDATGLLGGLRLRGLGPQVAERAEPPLADDPFRILGDDAEHAADRAPVVGQGAVGEGVVGLLRVAAPLQEQEEPLVPGGHPGLQHRLDPRPDVGPDLLPYPVRSRTEGPGVLDPQRRPVGVVAEERELPAPGHPHRVTRREHDPHRGLEALRPRLDRAERRLRPVEGTHERAHLAAAGETIIGRSGLVSRCAHGASVSSRGTTVPGCFSCNFELLACHDGDGPYGCTHCTHFG